MEKKFKCQNPRFFDLNHPNTSEICHPYIQSAKSSFFVRRYMQKDGDVIDWGMFQKHGTSTRNQNFDPNTTYGRALVCNAKDEALQVIRDEQPRDFLLQHHNINFNLDRVYEIPTAPWVCPFPLSSFTNVLEDLQEWADSYFGIQAAARPVRPKSVIIEGYKDFENWVHSQNPLPEAKPWRFQNSGDNLHLSPF
ncbi:uncharacterized protein LOC110901998 [Helianthus annuus]|uniref:uncharacterized protein LOC110901998 n=1 Tax=Helianthus annuus TaxID=4232 RepID=UPI000B8F1810|nr:uncharacterized protein LOC110901998 [Helianthus annuus]